MSQVRLQEKKHKRAAWPLIGFILALALGAISYTLAPSVLTFLRSRAPGIGAAINQNKDLYMFAVSAIIFLILVSIAALFVTLLSPRKRSIVKTSDVEKQRAALILEQKRDKVRQRYVNQQFRDHVKEKSKEQDR